MSSKKRKRESSSTESVTNQPFPVHGEIQASINTNSSSTPTSAPMSINLDENQSIGWRAIDVSLANMYPGASAVHFATPVPYALGGSDPLNAVSAYDVSMESDQATVSIGPTRTSSSSKAPSEHHWHFVTYGFSELFEKSPSNDAQVSGYGFELTMRLAPNDTRKTANEKSKNRNLTSVSGAAQPCLDACPTWAVEFLQSLARYVFSTGTKFDIGHHMCLNGALGAPPSTDSTHSEGANNNITAIIFVEDPLLKTMNTPNGTVKFLQVVGITQDEYELNWETSTQFVAELIKDTFGPLLITRLSRPSALTNSEIKAKAELKAKTSGSTHSSLYNRQISWMIMRSEQGESSLAIQIGANIVSQFVAILKRRLPYGLPFTCIGTTQQASCAIVFRSSPQEEPKGPKLKKAKNATSGASTQSSWSISPENSTIIELYLNKVDLDTIIQVTKPVQGIYPISPTLSISVAPTFIKDASTSAPIKIVGQ